ncbi:SH3 domain-containing protein [Streptomyces sp. 7N604]|uniref:SH3 domain-containing protein n=1 Tax=Streptomyces sp. 7N604 TaxID=3457415 RepID=UPI003FCEF447
MRTRNRIAGGLLAVAAAGMTAAAAPTAVAAAPARAQATDVVAYDTAGVLKQPDFSDPTMLSEVRPGYSYPGLCYTEGETVTDNGVTNNVWIRIALNAGGSGYVPALYFKGDAHAGVPNHC